MQKSTSTRGTIGAFLPSRVILPGAPILQRLCDALLSVVLAPSCAACGALLEQPTAGPVCLDCWRSITPLTPPLCARCADPLPTWRRVDAERSCCSRCRRRAGILECARAVGAYDGALGAIVESLPDPLMY